MEKIAPEGTPCPPTKGGINLSVTEYALPPNTYSIFSHYLDMRNGYLPLVPLNALVLLQVGYRNKAPSPDFVDYEVVFPSKMHAIYYIHVSELRLTLGSYPRLCGVVEGR